MFQIKFITFWQYKYNFKSMENIVSHFSVSKILTFFFFSLSGFPWMHLHANILSINIINISSIAKYKA